MKTMLLKFILLTSVFLIVLTEVMQAQYDYNKAASFNGTSSYIAVPDDAELNPTTNITVEAWVYPKSYGTYGCGTILGKNWNSSYWFGFNCGGGTLRFYPRGGTRVDGIAPIPLNKWTHVAASYDGTTTKLFINGIEDISSVAITGEIGVNTDSLFIGCDRDVTNKNYWFDGMIDNVRIWSITRTQQQIFDNRFIPFQILFPSGTFTGLAATYNMDWDARDWSGNVYNTGTFRNVTLVNQYPNNYVDYNNTLVLDGASYLAGPNISDYNATNAITLEAWILYNSEGVTSPAQNIVNKSGGSTRYDYALFLRDDGKLAMEVNGGGTSWTNTDVSIPTGKWTHVAGTYKASTGNIKLFINGELKKDTIVTAILIPNNTDSLYIGGIGATMYNANKFKGQIDEIKIWKDSVRTPELIKLNMYRTRKLSDEFNYTCFVFGDYTNRPWVSNNGISTPLNFYGNPFFSSPNLQNDLYSTSPVLREQTSNFHSGYTFSNKNLNIFENGTVTDSIYVTSTQSAYDLNLFVLINHINVSDLRITLISPAGTTIDLLPTSGTYAGNDIMTIFTMSTDSLIKMDGTGLVAPFSHIIKPVNSLWSFGGETITGWWKLSIQDVVANNKGYINGWGLKFVDVVPVELTTFTGTVQGSDIQLNWFTAAETNNRGFTIERKNSKIKKDESEWQAIGFVAGKGTCSEASKYFFTDSNIPKGKYTYRLVQIDLDGTTEYSKEIEVEVGTPDNFSLEQNYPNPFNPVTTIKYSLPQTMNVTIKVFDILGKEVAALVNAKKDAGKYEVEFSAKGGALNLTSGIYFYRIEAGEFVVTKKMTLLK